MTEHGEVTVGAQGCNAQSSWNGNHEIKYCARPVGHPGEHRSSLVSEWDTLKWRDDDDPVPASQSVPAVPVSSTGGKETGEAAEGGTGALRADHYAGVAMTEANEQVDDDWTTADTLAFREYFGERLATRLADLGLLADPAQTTELEELRALNRKLTLALDAARVPHEAPYVDDEHRGGNCIDVIMREKAASHQLACENVDMQVRIATLTAEVERLRQHLSASDGAEREWHNLATKGVTASAKWKGQRDALSLLLRGMARKLVVARGEMLKTRIDAALAVCDEYPAGWNSPTLAHDRLRAALVGDQPRAKTPWFVVRHCCEAGARAYPDPCPWHPALSGVALRDVEERDDAAGDLP